MSVKKLLSQSFATALLLTTGSIFAGGPKIIPQPPVERGFYIDGDIGYASVDWLSPLSFIEVGNIYFGSDSNRRGGFTFGGDIGYQVNRFLAIEFGSYYLPQVNFAHIGSDFLLLNTFKIDSWLFYAAGKLMAPVPFIDNLDIFFKAGAAFRSVHINSFIISEQATSGQSESNLNAMLGVGLQYHFTENFSINGQWLHVAEGGVRPGDTGLSTSFPTPADNLFIFGFGYLFRI